MPYKNKEEEREYYRQWCNNNREYQRQWCKDNIKKIKKYNKQYRENHKEHIKEHMKEYYENNREKLKKQHKLYYENNREKGRKRGKLYRKNNKEKEKKRKKQWAKNNPEKINKATKRWQNNPEKRNNYDRNRRKTDLKVNLNHRISIAIGLSIKGNKAGRHWEIIVDYTLSDLIKRLNKTMPAGYTWKDFLSGKLQIDHIIPISVFNFTRPEHTDFRRCWALSNLRFLPAKENLIKKDKLDRPFQPALRI